MNQKIVFVSIIAIVTAFAVSSLAIGLGNNQAFAATKCSNGSGTLVGANVCNVKVCANVNALGSQNALKCKNSD